MATRVSLCRAQYAPNRHVGGRPTKDYELMKFRWIRQPIQEKLNMFNMWEHTPLDYYRYGEYPRFLRSVRNDPQWEWVKLYEDGSVKRPGE